MQRRSSANGISGRSPSQPQNKGFDEFYGIPPGDTWDVFGIIRQGRQTKALDLPLEKGPHVVEAKRGEPLRSVKPYTEEVRRDIDWELVDHGVDFMKRQKAAAKPFFLFLPISRTHFPNLPSKRFEDASRIGQFGDSLMEGDAIVGSVLDSLKELGLEKDTIVVFASDNGPGWTRSENIRRRHAGHRDARTVPWRARRHKRRRDPHRGHHPVAGTDSAARFLRDVLDHGLLPDLRAPHGRQSP